MQFVAPAEGTLSGIIEFTEPSGAIVFAFVRLDEEGPLHQREYLVVGAETHGCPPPGTTVGLRFREDRLRLFDASGVAVPRDQAAPAT